MQVRMFPPKKGIIPLDFKRDGFYAFSHHNHRNDLVSAQGR
jgi:hypothetical protein